MSEIMSNKERLKEITDGWKAPAAAGLDAHRQRGAV